MDTENNTKKEKLTLIEAAILILGESETPLSCAEIVKLAKEKEIWQPGAGKTPDMTLYSSIHREMCNKGDAARFKKSDIRGKFVLANH